MAFKNTNMKQISLIIFLFSLCNLSAQNRQNDSIVISYYDLTGLKTYYSKVDLSPWIALKDSGVYLDNLKDGLWIEYPIDTSIMESNTNIRNDSIKSYIYKPDINKQTGLYKSGKKDGRWSFYFQSKALNGWFLDKVVDYKNGLKDGLEVKYMPWGIDTAMLVKYVLDEPIELTTYYAGGKIRSIVKQIDNKTVQIDFDENGLIISEEILK